jgi:hypothetical protein
MTYAVTWALAADALLNRLIAAADDPDRIRQAAAWVDYSLRRHPTDLGESRETPGERLWYGDVLGVYYSVDENARTVTVLSVGPARRR